MKRQGSMINKDIQVLSFQQKIQNSKYLLKLIQYGKLLRLTDFMFGYTLATAHIPLGDMICIDLKERFNNLDELRMDKLLNNQSIVLIVLDAIFTKKGSYFSTYKQQMNIFMNTLTFNIEETIMNNSYIIQKWRNQDALLQQNRKNELALKKFLQKEKQQLKMKAEEADSQGWECQICCCDIQKNDIGILQCGHIFHPQCIHGFLKTKIQSNEIELFCPMEECKKSIQIGDIYRFIDGDIRQKYQKFTFNKFIEQNNSSTSWCPTAGCQAAFQFDQGLDNYRCPACSKHYCLKCRCEYHYGMSCAQYRINNSFDKNDQQFINFVQGAKFKQCPKCKYWVERNEGCSTMSCKCGQQFCYDCGGTSCPHGSCSNSGKVARINPPPPPPPPKINVAFGNLFGQKKRKK